MYAEIYYILATIREQSQKERLDSKPEYIRESPERSAFFSSKRLVFFRKVLFLLLFSWKWLYEDWVVPKKNWYRYQLGEDDPLCPLYHPSPFPSIGVIGGKWHCPGTITPHCLPMYTSFWHLRQDISLCPILSITSYCISATRSTEGIDLISGITNLKKMEYPWQLPWQPDAKVSSNQIQKGPNLRFFSR